MKKIFVIAVVSIVAGAATAQGAQITEEQKQRIVQYATLCAEQNLIDSSAVEALKVGQFSNTDRKVKCFANCFLERAGLLVNGEVQKGAILHRLAAVFGVEKIRAAMAQCGKFKGVDNCETAFELYKCFFQTNAALN